MVAISQRAISVFNSTNQVKFERRTPVLVTFGDSIIAEQSSAQNDPSVFQPSGSSGQYAQYVYGNETTPPTPVGNTITGGRSLGFVERALIKLNQPFHHVANLGISGDTTTGMLARMWNLIQYNPSWVIMDGGTNDNFNGVPLTGTGGSIDNLINIYETMQKYGITVIDTTNTATTADATQAAVYQKCCINEFKMDWASCTPGFYCCDLAGVSIDTSSLSNSFSTPVSSYFRDGLHPNSVGGRVFGDYLYNFMDPIVPRLQRRSFFNTDGTSGATNILNKNPLFIQGSGGVASSGGTGTVAQNWSLFRNNGANITGAGSIVTRALLATTFPTVFGDGRPGYVQQIDLANSQASNEQMNLQGAPASVPASLSGPWVAECEVAVTVGSGTLTRLQMNVFVNASPSQFGIYCNRDSTGTDYMDVSSSTNAFFGVMRTKPFWMPAGVIAATPLILMGTSSGGTASVYVSNFYLRPLQSY